MTGEPVRWTPDMTRAIRDPWAQPAAGPERGRRPREVTAAGWALVARALLRLPLPIFVVLHLADDVAFVPLRRSSDAPDGARFIWLAYAGADPDNAVLYPSAALLGGARHATAIWLVLHLVATGGYLVAGLRLRRRPVVGARLRRVVVLLFGLDLGWRLLWLVLVLPGAIDALHTGENHTPLPRTRPPVHGESYSGEHLVHLYEWMFLPWTVAGVAVTTAIAVLWWRRAR